MPHSRPIIIIEDDMDDQEILKEVFSEMKVPNLIHFFNSCLHALDYLLTTLERPFLIISDINLPAMTGMELKKEICNNEYLRNKNIPFVFLTTNPDIQIITQAYRWHAQGYFVKPPTMKELKEMLHTIIGYWKTSHVLI